MILEPVMMNAGIIPPDDGYLAAIRDLVHADGAFLIYDEVKTGFTTGPGGITARSGVVPDMVCLAKALGGGIAVAAIGGTDDRDVGDRRRPLRAGRHVQRQPAGDGGHQGDAAPRCSPPTAYAHLDELSTRLRTSLEAIIAKHGFGWHVVTAGAKGCVTFRRDPVREFRDFLQIDARLGHLHWLMQHNGGVFLPPWGKVEQWLLSVQHDRDDVDRFAANFARFADTFPGSPRWRSLLDRPARMKGGAIRLRAAGQVVRRGARGNRYRPRHPGRSVLFAARALPAVARPPRCA